jgi:Homeodomain-like domain
VSNSGGYTRNEIAFLLSLQTHDEALEHAVKLASSLGKLANESSSAGFCPDENDVPFIAMWAEVHAAKNRIVANKEHLAITQLHLQGYSDEEIATAVGVGRVTIWRRRRATLQEILDMLGGEAEPLMPLDHIDLCLMCGQRPRARVMRRMRRWTGSRWKVKTVERPSSSCEACVAPEEA